MIIYGLSNELQKRVMNANNTNKKYLHDTLWKYVEDKVKNITAEEMKRKSLSGFWLTSNWRGLYPDVS